MIRMGKKNKHAKWTRSLLKQFGLTIIDCNVKSVEELDSLLDFYEKTYRDVWDHAQKHEREGDK